ncbi:MAG: hypothetical protein WBN17_14945 [Aureibaculum sp.]|jgi:hypothetical protein
MSQQPKKEKHISRRGILPFLGSALLIPFLGFGNTETKKETPVSENEEEYQTLLKPDGTTVKVKVSTLKKSKIIKKNISNTSFLNWLGKKL